MNAAFFDTNILIYAADSAGPDADKRDRARLLMQSREVTISTQVMMEFYGVLRRKLAYGPDVATQWIETLQDEHVVSLAAADVVHAIKLSRRYDISHWDGLVLTAAERAGLDILYTEDLNHGQTYGSVRVCNPFIEDFLA
ncbi:MAG: PIN domain-containing protein [Mesorhizobium sp.]